MLYLTLATPHNSASLWKMVKRATADRLSPEGGSAGFPLARLLYLILALTIGVSVPALLWFCAVAISSVTDVTAIWNTNAFFAYILSVKAFGLKWETRKLAAVVLATLGVMAVVYGGANTPESGDPSAADATASSPPGPSPSTQHLAGDLLTLIGSVGYGCYQVGYKKYAALSSDPDPEGLDDREDYQRLPVADAEPGPEAARRLSGHDELDIAQAPPFGLHSNFLTSSIGLCTLLLLWIPLPFLHWSGAEPFKLPSNGATVSAIAAIGFTGSLFNAGFMILLGLWGPIITSVGGLLTIVLVFFSDVLLGATEAFNLWTVSGSAIIIAAFGVLAYDMVGR
ncbi:hypothetical protein V5O48_000447 [Marasmius crinis-equi]|uniref:EamA domain-containing protein n=1 Tax=Marasmius crinis-equi TaxID=585013 RepID=A0ABR3G1B3_9AGAR